MKNCFKLCYDSLVQLLHLLLVRFAVCANVMLLLIAVQGFLQEQDLNNPISYYIILYNVI